MYTLILCLLGNFECFFVIYRIISKSTISKNYFRNAIRVLSSLDPDQAGRFVGPDLGPNCTLGPNCLPRLTADDTSRQRVKVKTGFMMD